jgi:hypothetical protein
MNQQVLRKSRISLTDSSCVVQCGICSVGLRLAVDEVWKEKYQPSGESEMYPRILRKQGMRIRTVYKRTYRNTCALLYQPWLPYILVRIQMLLDDCEFCWVPGTNLTKLN